MGAEAGVNGGGVGAGGREGWVQCDNLGCRRWARPPPSFWAKAGKGKAGGVAETGATAGAETGDGEERAAKEEDWAKEGPVGGAGRGGAKGRAGSAGKRRRSDGERDGSGRDDGLDEGGRDELGAERRARDGDGAPEAEPGGPEQAAASGLGMTGAGDGGTGPGHGGVGAGAGAGGGERAVPAQSGDGSEVWVGSARDGPAGRPGTGRAGAEAGAGRKFYCRRRCALEAAAFAGGGDA